MMKVRSLIYFFLLLCFLPLAAQAQEGVTLEAFVDQPHIALDDQLVLTVRVKGGNVFTEPSIPNRGNFEVLSRGSSSQVQMVNGRLNVTKEYTYVLQPLKAGNFEIGPISIFVEGVEKQSTPISVSVGETGRSAPGPMPGAGFPQGFPAPPMGVNPFGPSQSPSQPLEGQYKDIFVTAEVDNKNPYKGEQILYTFRLYTSKGVGEAKLNLPEFHDFWSEEIDKESKYYKELEGRRYVVSEFKVALFANKAGSLVIPSSTLRAQVEEPMNLPSAFNDPFFTMRGAPMNYRPRVFKSPEVSLEVKELPSGAPGDFTGLVGEFSVAASLTKKDLSVGDSGTLSIQISGRGNIKDAQLQPNFQIPGLKIYEDKPVLETKKGANGISGSKTFKYALVPENPGKMVVPPLNISYFDPKKNSYETLTTPSYELSVVPGTAQEKLNKAQGSTADPNVSNPLAEDIATIHSPKRLENQKYSFDFYYWVLILFAAPPVVFLLAYLMSRRQRWRDENSELLRKRRAYGRASDRLKSLNLSNSDEIYPQTSHILRDYLGDKFSLMGAALTPMEIENLLVNRAHKKPAAQAFVELMRELDASVYGGRPDEKGWEKSIQKKAVQVLKALDKELP